MKCTGNGSVSVDYGTCTNNGGKGTGLGAVRTDDGSINRTTVDINVCDRLGVRIKCGAKLIGLKAIDVSNAIDVEIFPLKAGSTEIAGSV